MGFSAPENISLITLSGDYPGINCLKYDYSGFFKHIYQRIEELLQGDKSYRREKFVLNVKIEEKGTVKSKFFLRRSSEKI
jgi:hypothetical protein